MVNYTDEQTKELVETYLAAKDKPGAVEELMEKFNKPKRSIIGKLSKEGVYKKQTYKTKVGRDPITKKELVANLSKTINADPEQLQSLIKVSKMELEYLIERVNNLTNQS